MENVSEPATVKRTRADVPPRRPLRLQVHRKKLHRREVRHREKRHRKGQQAEVEEPRSCL